MESELYARDFLLWTEDQAARLRRVAAGEAVNAVDWPEIIEELEDLGRSELNGVASHLRRALEHLAKAAAWPAHRDLGHWLAEADTFLANAGQRATPAMHRRLDVQGLYERALRTLRLLGSLEGIEPAPLVTLCPFSVEELLATEFAPREATARLRSSAS